jgi:hypothetical protein
MGGDNVAAWIYAHEMFCTHSKYECKKWIRSYQWFNWQNSNCCHVCEILLASLQQFKKCAKKENISRKRLLCFDIDTRWNATSLMLDNAIILENAFARLNKENKQLKIYFEGNLPLNENNWCNARCVIYLLKVFYKVTMCHQVDSFMSLF